MLIRRRPNIFNELDRAFEDLWRANDTTTPRRDNYALALDVQETDKAYIVITALPGVSSDNIDIRLHDGSLTINAEIPAPSLAEGAQLRLQERRYGKFSRTLHLPQEVQSDAIEADYANGLLTITIPKVEAAQPRTIPVRVNNHN